MQVLFGSVTGAVVSSGGEQYVASGGVAAGTRLNSGAYGVVFGTDSSATVSGGATEYVFGQANSATVLTSGSEVVESAGKTSATTLGGGIQYDFGTTTATLVSGGQEIVESGGSASGTVVVVGAQLYVSASGSVSGTILRGGNETVFGTDVSATISGGTQYDYSSVGGGTTLSGGFQIVEAGAAASGMTVSSGGEQYVAAGATTLATQLSGGEEFVGGGTASNTLVGSGGYEYIASGGVAISSTISGGEIEIVSGGTASGGVLFANSAGGMLRLDDSQVFSGTISGFGKPEYLDLSDIAFNSATTTVGFTEDVDNLSGTLTVTDGTHTAHLTLIGQYTTAQFTKATDGHGGTLIGDPPVTATATNDSAILLGFAPSQHT